MPLVVLVLHAHSKEAKLWPLHGNTHPTAESHMGLDGAYGLTAWDAAPVCAAAAAGKPDLTPQNFIISVFLLCILMMSGVFFVKVTGLWSFWFWFLVSNCLLECDASTRFQGCSDAVSPPPACISSCGDIAVSIWILWLNICWRSRNTTPHFRHFTLNAPMCQTKIKVSEGKHDTEERALSLISHFPTKAEALNWATSLTFS